MTPNDNEVLRSMYRDKQPAAPPLPWKKVPTFVSGITAIGFAEETEYLLVLTHSGLGIVDCISGETVDYINDENQLDSLIDDPYPVWATGIGPLHDQHIRLAGLWGGGLRTTSKAGWTLHKIAPHWPKESILLCPPDHPELGDNPEQSVILLQNDEVNIRAFGFSNSGKTAVIATSDLHIWTQQET